MANDYALGCLAFFIVIVVSLWWLLTPHPGFWQGDKSTAFIATCSVAYKDDDCPDVETPAAAFTYRVNRNTGEVAWLKQGSSEATMGVMKNCSIYDADNWSCESSDLRESMLEGNLVYGHYYPHIRIVSRWCYKYLRVKEWLF